MQLILPYLAPKSVNFVEVNVRIFADTSGQSIQMVNQIFLSFQFIFLFVFFFGYFFGVVRGPVSKVVHVLGPWGGGSTDWGSVFSGHLDFSIVNQSESIST